NDGRDYNPLNLVQAQSRILEQIMNRHAVLVHGRRLIRADSPVVQKRPPPVYPEHDIRIADVRNENHAVRPPGFLPPRSRLMSSASNEYVSPPTEMTSTPVAAMPRTVSSRTPPDASIFTCGARDLISRTA